EEKRRVLVIVYPACAGIDPKSLDGLGDLPGLPRMRGDRPVVSSTSCIGFLFTPHARGSTLVRRSRSKTETVYPACAGIDPLAPGSKDCPMGLPRMRGDRPMK